MPLPSSRRDQLLQLLLDHKTGQTVDDLARALQVSRNAVRQHLTSLLADGLVIKGPVQATKGRPEQLYLLSPAGYETFPRQYSWFSELLLHALKAERGEQALISQFEHLGTQVASDLLRSHRPDSTDTERIQALVATMRQLGYEAKTTVSSGQELPLIEASNCVFHHLASRFPEICHFDLALISTYTGHAVQHEECLARGGHLCRFRFAPTP